ncbi:MAG TPA: glycoside hydrolase family 3 C-terminal domain-containing protein [Polyangiaceae bacterium]|nr:glycoside hydrolase family 3 C-terminal domain-containing protein [Polyangiaceae bacterium]
MSDPLQENRYEHAFQNPDLPLDRRIDCILSLMTLSEKVDCLGTNPSVPRLGIQGCGHLEGLHGLALGGPGRWGNDHPLATTTFPQAIGLAQTWDPDLVCEAAAAIAHEARYVFQSPRYRRGGLVIRAPNADLGRDPRWGRTEECYGEDPFLAGTMAVAFTRGLQGDDPRYWKAAALLKHFFANSNENGRESTSSDFDEALFRDYYSVPFRMAIQEGGARAFMTAYNAHNGIPCTIHPVLSTVAASEWQHDGIVCTDAEALELLVTAHHSHPDTCQAAAASVRAGITQFLGKHREAVAGALDRGLLSEGDIDRVLRGNFRVMLRLGLVDPPSRVPYSSIGSSDEEPWSSEAHRAAVLRATQASIVLLKNAGGLLPLDPERVGSVAVLGPLADRVLIDWYSGTPPYTVSPLDGIRNRVGSRLRVRSATNNDDSDAVRLARESDVCVVCVGNHPTGDAPWAQVTRPSYGKEAVDRRSIELEDEALVRKVWDANPRTVVVLIASFPYAIAWSQDRVPAIVHMTHNSQELGTALAAALFGDANPAGRLVQTWPRSTEDLLPMMDYDIRHGRTYMYLRSEPLYPFGFGLSYTTFEYRAIHTSTGSVAADGSVDVVVDVHNAGTRAGDEVLQLYTARSAPSEHGPRALRGFRRVHLAPGETKSVPLRLDARALAAWNSDRGCFQVQGGEVDILVGRSSAQIELRRRLMIVA